jgi:hypothetical protein
MFPHFVEKAQSNEEIVGSCTMPSHTSLIVHQILVKGQIPTILTHRILQICLCVTSGSSWVSELG